MAKGTIARIDERGRIIIPAPYRDALSLKEGSNVLLRIDDTREALVIIPFAANFDKLAKIRIEMGDEPGTLSRILKSLADERIDIIRSESTAQERGRSAEWNAVVDVSKTRATTQQLKKKLIRAKLAREIQVEMI